MTETNPPVLQIRGLSADYLQGGVRYPVLWDVSLDIGRGELVGLVGESGSGKSTLAALVMGERRDDRRISSGSIVFDDVDLFTASRAVVRRLRGARLAFVPQNCAASLTPTMRIGPLFAETLRCHRPDLGAAALRDRIRGLLEDVGLTDPGRAMSRYPHEFSGGQQQRIAIALAISCEPILLVLDEPTTGLDPIIRRSITRLLRALAQAHGVAMLFVSHDLATVDELCGRVAVMYAGQIVESGPTRAIFSAPRHAYTQALITAVPRLDRPGTRVQPFAGEADETIRLRKVM